MQKIIEKVIESKNFELSDMLKKIDTLWVQGSIDEETKKKLADKARNNASLDKSFDFLSKLEELDKRVKALEEELNKENATPEEPTESYEEYVVGKWYYTGNRITFEGKVYECIAPENAACVWNPVEYPTYWKEVE